MSAAKSSANEAGLPPRARQLLEVLYDTITGRAISSGAGADAGEAGADSGAALDRDRWIGIVREEFQTWKSAQPRPQRKRAASSGDEKGLPGSDVIDARVDARHAAEHALGRIALETLAEQTMLAEGEDLRPRIGRSRLESLLGELDPKDLEMYRRCELRLERASRVAVETSTPRDEVLRRWSRARQSILDRVRES